MLCLMRKNWASNKIFQEACLVSKKFAQLIAHFVPFCKVELFETSVKSDWKLIKFKVQCDVKREILKKSGTLEKVWNNDFLLDQLSKLVIEPNFIVDFLYQRNWGLKEITVFVHCSKP